MRRALLFIFIGLLSACAHPTARLPHENLRDRNALERARRELYRSSVDYQNQLEERVGSVYYALVKNTGQDLCDRKLKPSLGIIFSRSGRIRRDSVFAEEQQYIEDYNWLHKSKEGRVYVEQVYKSSAAYKAGIRRGDRLLSLYGVPAPSGADALQEIDDLFQTSAKSLEPVEILVARGDKTLRYVFKPEEICPYELVIDDTSHVTNAFSDGEKLYVTIEMIDYLQDDTLLAAVLAHELAHSTLGHIQDKVQNEWIGAFGGFFVDIMTGSFNNADNFADLALKAYSKDYEMEADYVSVYYLARAGFDLSKVQNLHKALSNRDRRSLYADGVTHPLPQLRYVLLKDTVEEIKLKRVFGDDLLPNFNEHNAHLANKKD